MKELPFPVLKKCPCVVVSHTGFPVTLVGERYLKWARIMSFPRMGWLLLGRRWGRRWMGPEPEPGVNPGVSSVQRPTPSHWRAKSGPKSLEQKPEGHVWASYACFQHLHRCPTGKQCWGQMGWSRCSAWVVVQIGVVLAPVILLGFSQSAVSLSTISGSPLSTQILHHARSGSQ